MSKETTATEKSYTILIPLSKCSSENWKSKSYYPFLFFHISVGPFLTSGPVVSLVISTHLTRRKSVKPEGISSVSNKRSFQKQPFPEIRFPIKKPTKINGNSSQISNSNFRSCRSGLEHWTDCLNRVKHSKLLFKKHFGSFENPNHLNNL